MIVPVDPTTAGHLALAGRSYLRALDAAGRHEPAGLADLVVALVDATDRGDAVLLVVDAS